MKRLRRAHQKRIKKSLKPLRGKLRRKVISAGTSVAITLGMTGLNKAIAGNSQDLHQQIVNQDSDTDQLSNAEEIAIG